MYLECTFKKNHNMYSRYMFMASASTIDLVIWPGDSVYKPDFSLAESLQGRTLELPATRWLLAERITG
jgi:hypothetical protein